jgi:hypothetical protein
MAQLIECLPSKGKDLSSNPSTTTKKEWGLWSETRDRSRFYQDYSSRCMIYLIYYKTFCKCHNVPPAQ